MKILEIKAAVIRIKHLINGLKNENTDDRRKISGFEDRRIENFKSEKNE